MALINGWRIGGWGVAAGLLLLPAVAMQFTREVQWDETDFIVMGIILGSVGLGIEFLMRKGSSMAYRAGAAVMMLALFLTVWINLAVGVIGSENNDANWMYAGVISVAVGGAIVAHFRPAGMVWVMVAAALAEWLVAGLALAFNLGTDGVNWPKDLIGVTGIFTVLWLLASGLFARAARARP